MLTRRSSRTVEHAVRNHALTVNELALFFELRKKYGTRPFPLNVQTDAERGMIEELLDQKFLRQNGNNLSCQGEPIGSAWKNPVKKRKE